MKEKLTLTIISSVVILGLLYGIYACYFEMLFIFEWIDLFIIPMSLGLITFFVTVLYYVWRRNFKLKDL